jgi:hypothetical protein
MTVRDLLKAIGLEEWGIEDPDFPRERLDYRLYLPEEKPVFDALVNDIYSEVNLIP